MYQELRETRRVEPSGRRVKTEDYEGDTDEDKELEICSRKFYAECLYRAVLLVLGFCSSSCSLPCFYRVWGWLVCKDLAIGFKVAGRDESSADGERPGVFAEINLVSKISTIGDVHMHIVVTKLNNSGLRRRNRIDRTPILLKNQARCWEVHIHSIRMEKVRSAKPTIRNMVTN
jgi:hypothetical protein